MKKVVIPVLMAAAIMSTINANAQQKKNFISGELGFGSSKQVTNGQPDIKGSTFYISPTYGRYLNEKFSIGISLSFATTDTQEGITQIELTAKSYSISPFVRFEQPIWNSKVSVYNELGVNVGFGTVKYDQPNINDGKNNTFLVYYRPGLMFNFTPRSALIANLGPLLSASTFTSKRDNGSSKHTETNVGITNGFGINSIRFGYLFRF